MAQTHRNHHRLHPFRFLSLALISLLVWACAVFPADPYFTDATLSRCKDRSGQTHLLFDPHIDGIYAVQIFLGGVVPAVDEVGAVEVLGGDPAHIHFVAGSQYHQLVYKARGGDPWQPASRKYEEAPSDACVFI